MTLSQRQGIIEQYANDVKAKYPEITSYNILIFGSFLTSRYSEESDIDIGIFSLQPGLTFRLYTYTKDYFDNLGIPSDVVRMRLSHSQYINLAIITSNTYAVTNYCPDALIQYTKEMLDLYGSNPQKKILNDLRREVTIA